MGRSTTGYVRPLVPEDLPQVAELYLRVFDPPATASREGARSALEEIFFCHPWPDDGLPSLVYEDKNGKILGCLGVMPRPMSMNGRAIRAAISHTVMVEPNSRTTPAGVELIRAFLSGRQDVSIAQSTSRSRRIYEAIGGTTSLLYSLGWTRVLRPSRYVLAYLERRGLPPVVSAALTPVCHVADTLTGRLLRGPFRLSDPGLSGEELDAETLATCLSEFASDRALRPTYDTASLKWLLGLLARQTGDVAFTRMLMRDSSGEIVGAYLYYRTAAGVGDVVQLVARPKSVEAVLDHLFADAYRHRLLAVAGQLDPRSLPALEAKHCFFNRGDVSWMLVHSRDPELLAAVHQGDAFLTRLEAEWWIGFVLTRALGLVSPRARLSRPGSEN